MWAFRVAARTVTSMSSSVIDGESAIKNNQAIVARPIGVTTSLSASQESINNSINLDIPKDKQLATAMNTPDAELAFPEKLRPNEKGFFDLPGEIRNTIYETWFTRKAAVLSLKVSRNLIKSGDGTWATAAPVLNWYLRWDRSAKLVPLETNLLRVCQLMNAESNATLFSGETAIELRDPIGTASIDRLHQYIRDPMCARPLHWARQIKLSLYPILSEESGRQEFAKSINSVIDVLDGGSRLNSLDIHIHVSDHPTKEQVEGSMKNLEGFRVKGSLKIQQFVYGYQFENWIPDTWGHQLLKLMEGGEKKPSYIVYHKTSRLYLDVLTSRQIWPPERQSDSQIVPD